METFPSDDPTTAAEAVAASSKAHEGPSSWCDEPTVIFLVGQNELCEYAARGLVLDLSFDHAIHGFDHTSAPAAAFGLQTKDANLVRMNAMLTKCTQYPDFYSNSGYYQLYRGELATKSKAVPETPLYYEARLNLSNRDILIDHDFAVRLIGTQELDAVFGTGTLLDQSVRYLESLIARPSDILFDQKWALKDAQQEHETTSQVRKNVVFLFILDISHPRDHFIANIANLISHLRSFRSTSARIQIGVGFANFGSYVSAYQFECPDRGPLNDLQAIWHSEVMKTLLNNTLSQWGQLTTALTVYAHAQPIGSDPIWVTPLPLEGINPQSGNIAVEEDLRSSPPLFLSHAWISSISGQQTLPMQIAISSPENEPKAAFS